MKIVTMNNRYYLLTDGAIAGHILHSENTLTEMIDYCKSEWAAAYERELIDIDESTVYHDNEHDYYITDNELMEYFDDDYSLIDEYGTYSAWISECTSKNGTLTRVK